MFKSAITYWILAGQCLLLLSNCYAQQINEINISNSNSVTLDDLQNFSVVNAYDTRVNVIFELRLSDKTAAEVYKATSAVVTLEQGITQINRNNLSAFEQSFLNSDFRKSISNGVYLPEGSYTLCIFILSAIDKTEISNQCVGFNVFKSISGPSSVNRNKPFQLSGQTNISGFFTDFVPVNSELAPGSVELSSRFMIDIYGIPLTSSFLLSTEQSVDRQNINKFNISFDSREFIRDLKQKVTDKITSEQNVRTSRNIDILKSRNELSELNTKLDQPQVKTELAQIDQMKQLRQQIDTTTDSSDLAKLKEKLRQYDEISQKAKGYERLLERKNELEGTISKVKDSEVELSKKFDLKTLDNPDVLKQKLTDYHLLRKSTEYLLWVNKFQLGTSIPDLTSLTWQNSPLNGIYTELQPGWLYVSFLYGKAMNTVISPMANQLSYKRRAFAGGLGIGRKESTHLHFYVLSIEDDTNSIIQTDTFAYYRRNPASNKVLSADLQLNFLKNRIIFKAEIAGSQLISNKFLKDKSEILVDSQSITGFTDADKWFTNIISQQHNSLYAAVDYACKMDVTVRIDKTATILNADIQRTGKDFESFGVPYIRKDVVRYNFVVNQSFLKKKITLKAFLRLDEFDRTHQSSTSSHYLFYGTDISVKFPKMPFFRLSISPVTQVSDSIQFELNNYTFSTGYSYHIGKSQLFSNLILNRQATINGPATWAFSATNLSFIQNINFPRAFSLSLNLSYMDFTINDSSGNYSNIGFSVFYNIKNWQNQLGMSTFLYNNKKNKYGVYYQISFPLSNYMQFLIRIERNVYDNPIHSEFLPNYEQWMIRGSINIKF